TIAMTSTITIAATPQPKTSFGSINGCWVELEPDAEKLWPKSSSVSRTLGLAFFMRRRPRGERRSSAPRVDSPHCGPHASPQAPAYRGARASADTTLREPDGSPH